MATAAEVKAYAEQYDVSIKEASERLRQRAREDAHYERLAQRDHHLNNMTTYCPVPSDMAAAIRFLLENMK